MLDFAKAGGIVPAIAQDADTGEVLMLAWMNAKRSRKRCTGRACYFSRSRGRLWRKGEESGNVQEVKEIHLDCDTDTVLLQVNKSAAPPATKDTKSCFFRKLEAEELKVIAERVFDPKQVYKKN